MHIGGDRWSALQQRLRGCILLGVEIYFTLVVSSATTEEVTLWRSGDDPYSAFNTTIGHADSCQPECSEERVLVLAPGIPYRVSVEVMQADMQSHTEFIEVIIGESQRIVCNPMSVSDHACSLTACREVETGVVPDSRLRVRLKSYKTRDSCKCSFFQDGTVDCYSALLSGLGNTFGMLVQFRLTPDAQTKWTVDAWTSCSTWQCVDPDALSTRSVRCMALTAHSKSLPSPGNHNCPAPVPRSSRRCMDTPECAPPPPCNDCFTLEPFADIGQNLHWSFDPSSARVHMSTGSPILLKLVLAGLQNDSFIITQCSDEHYIAPGGNGDTMNLLYLDGVVTQADGHSHAAVRLRQTSSTGFAFEDLAGVSMIKAEQSILYMTRLPSPEPALESYTFTAIKKGASSVCAPSIVPSHVPPEACRSNLGWCCMSESPTRGGCMIPDTLAKARSCVDNACAGLALVENGYCEDILCAQITNYSDCAKVASVFGLASATSGGTPASVLVTASRPSFCYWDVTRGKIVYNAANSDMPADSSKQQLCRCDGGASQEKLLWSVGKWEPCSLNCENSWRMRNVTCVAVSTRRGLESSIEQPRGRCLEAGLVEPAQSEPCRVQSCFGMLPYTRCAGDERALSHQDIEMLGGQPPSNRTAGSHCVTLMSDDIRVAVNSCQQSCLHFGDCVGFTFYDVAPTQLEGSRMCCFLRRTFRSDKNLRHAACYMLHGVRSLNGCQCQVGWSQFTASEKERRVCGPERGGCCTTSDSGAVPWCPTTSLQCGLAKLQGEELWDYCNPEGIATVTEGTCQPDRLGARQDCRDINTVTQCNQIATALSLPDKRVKLVSSTSMPFGCIWQAATSQLLLNAVNGSKSDHPEASQEFAELCSCTVSSEYRWQVGNWGPCFRDPLTNCGALIRLRNVWCILQGTRDISSGGEVVSDGLCNSEKPTTQDMCSGCTGDTWIALAEFVVQSHELSRQSYREDFLHLSSSDLARAMGIAESRLHVKLVDYSRPTQIQAHLMIKESVLNNSDVRSSDALASLMEVAGVGNNFGWSSRFRRYGLGLSVSMIGVFRWYIHGAWGRCTETCGGGNQSRSIQCVLQDFKGPPQVGMPQDNCDLETKPADHQICSTNLCEACPRLKLGPEYAMSTSGVMEHGAVVHITCAAGYGTIDDTMLVTSQCQDGAWTPLAVSCGRSCSALEFDLQRYDVKGTGLTHGTTRQVVCRDRAMAAESLQSATAVCSNGEWVFPSLLCNGECQDLELSSAYMVLGRSTEDDGRIPLGDTRSVSCSSGYNSATTQLEATLVCSDGGWIDLKELPDCRADCLHYELAEGYEIQEVISSTACASGDACQRGARRLQSLQRMPHGTTVVIQCSDEDARVPGAAESVTCSDGHWSTLSLVCGRDCELDTSSPEYQGIELIGEEILTDLGQEVVTWHSNNSDAVRQYGHGSILVFTCRLAQEVKYRAAANDVRGQLQCINGAWTQSRRCFDMCPPIDLGPEYNAITPGLLTDMPALHGAQAFATCAEGFSSNDSLNVAVVTFKPGALGISEEGGSVKAVHPHGQAERVRVEVGWRIREVNGQQVNDFLDEAFQIAKNGQAPYQVTFEKGKRVVTAGNNDSMLFSEVICSDGHWSGLSLLCHKDCPQLQLDHVFTNSRRGVFKFNDRLRVHCVYKSQETDAKQPQELGLRCSEEGVWLYNQNITNGVDNDHVLGQSFALEHSCECIAFTRHAMREGAIAWNDAGDAYREVPAELIGATLFVSAEALPTGSLLVSSTADAMVYIFARGEVLLDSTWERIDFDGSTLKLGERQSLATWRRRIATGGSFEIAIYEPFRGGIAIKYNSIDLLSSDMPYKIMPKSSLCSSTALIQTAHECERAAKALGSHRDSGEEVYRSGMNKSLSQNVATVPINARAKSPPGCFVREDASLEYVGVWFNPDVGSAKISTSSEWPICVVEHAATIEVQLEPSMPFPLSCPPEKQPQYGTFGNNEEALSIFFTVALCLSIAGVAMNLARISRANRCASRGHDCYRTRVNSTESLSTYAGGSGWMLSTASGGSSSRDIAKTAFGNGGDQNAQYGKVQQTACLICRFSFATHVCFPCGHLCICTACAEEFTLRFVAGESGIVCPTCSQVIDCLIDGNPAGAFKAASSEARSSRQYLSLPQILGRRLGGHSKAIENSSL